MREFSIILPVRNGGNYVKECIHSILSQTYPHFNCIVLDNCSTDGTLEWIRSLQDQRIIIYASDKPLPIENNWARIVTVPKNEFMTCIGHDDILLPGYLKEMDDLIQEYPEAALYQSHFNYIDEKGLIIRKCKPVDEIQYPATFLEQILATSIDVNGTGFMTRSATYDAMGGIPKYPNLLFADLSLWLEITRGSYKITSPGNYFSYRLHQSMTTTSPDEKFQTAFELFIKYLYSLKQQEPLFGEVINEHAKTIIAFYCKSFSHRLLRTAKKKRNDLTVADWAKKCNEFADLLIDNNSYRPSAIPSVRLARIIDSTAVSRKMFLLFKKIYSKPIL
jgi:glycosyltransferase involved in cell wall biosynthesis